MLKQIMLAGLLALGLVGCAQVPMGNAGSDAKAKTFQTKPAVAGLYIYRNEIFGAAIHIDLALDGQIIGRTAPQTYFYTELAPGEHTITAAGENADTLTLNAEAGKNYYVWQEMKMGLLLARAKLHLMDETSGQKGVLECKLAVWGALSGTEANQSSTSNSKHKYSESTAPTVDTTPVPFLDEAGQALYQKYLTVKLPSAFAISEDGHYSYANGTSPSPDLPADAKDRAIAKCAMHVTTKPCFLYSVNRVVVYKETDAHAGGGI